MVIDTEKEELKPDEEVLKSKYWSHNNQLFHFSGEVFGVNDLGDTVNLGREKDVNEYLTTGISSIISTCSGIILNTAKNFKPEINDSSTMKVKLKKIRIKKLKKKLKTIKHKIKSKKNLILAGRL
jgi:hypothetical protein